MAIAMHGVHPTYHRQGGRGVRCGGGWLVVVATGMWRWLTMIAVANVAAWWWWRTKGDGGGRESTRERERARERESEKRVQRREMQLGFIGVRGCAWV